MIQTYLKEINNKETNPILVSLKLYAEENNVPIITDEGIHFIKQIIEISNAKKILEIGTAIGYSAIQMALSGCHVTTIERDEKMIELANKNIENAKLSDKINVIYSDALELDEHELGIFDLIFIDAAKSQSINFFNKYKSCLKSKGIIITDNLLFHGLVVEEIKERNLRQLTRKIDNFNHFVVSEEEFSTYIYGIGDGMSLSIKRM
ncbi:MAG: O-methyltransferase [Bacilli bacterium]|nr:O-methyltransferase [Bacilli bacterium]